MQSLQFMLMRVLARATAKCCVPHRRMWYNPSCDPVTYQNTLDFQSSNVSPSFVTCVCGLEWHYILFDHLNKQLYRVLSADLLFSHTGGSESAISDVSYCTTWSKGVYMFVQTYVMHCDRVWAYSLLRASPAPGAIPQPLLLQLVMGPWGGSKASGEVAGRAGAPPTGFLGLFFKWKYPAHLDNECNAPSKYVCGCFSGTISEGSGEAWIWVAESTTRCKEGVMQKVRGNVDWSSEPFPTCTTFVGFVIRVIIKYIRFSSIK